MARKKRYAQVGTGSRSGMYTKAIVQRYGDIAELVAICDVNEGRMRVKNEQIASFGGELAAMYKAADSLRIGEYPAHIGVLLGGFSLGGVNEPTDAGATETVCSQVLQRRG